MSFKVTRNHWETIVNFMEEHQDLARGRVGGPTGKDTAKKLWTELTLLLNSLGDGERSVQKWQKTWTDFKYVLKKKAADIKSDLVATGGGPSNTTPLSDLETRIINILGKSFYEGLGRSESGCRSIDYNNHFDDDSVQPSTSATDLTTDSPPKEHTTPRKTNIEIEKPLDKPTAVFDTPRVKLNNSHAAGGSPGLWKRKTPGNMGHDHDYTKRPVFRKKNRSMEAMYEDTLNELKEIKDCLKALKNSNEGIEKALNRIADNICEKKDV